MEPELQAASFGRVAAPDILPVMHAADPASGAFGDPQEVATPANVIPYLLLHSSDGREPFCRPQDWHLHSSLHHLLPWNPRDLSLSRLTCEDPVENVFMVVTSGADSQVEVAASLTARMFMVFTSFGDEGAPMRPADRAVTDDALEAPVVFHATPLTKEILIRATGIVLGQVEGPPVCAELQGGNHDMRALLERYVAALRGHVPRRNSLHGMRRFITDRLLKPMGGRSTVPQDLLWGGHVLNNYLHGLQQDECARRSFLRQWIVNNLARVTGVVGHPLNGNNRCAALDCAVKGTVPPCGDGEPQGRLVDRIRDFVEKEGDQQSLARVSSRLLATFPVRLDRDTRTAGETLATRSQEQEQVRARDQGPPPCRAPCDCTLGRVDGNVLKLHLLRPRPRGTTTCVSIR